MLNWDLGAWLMDHHFAQITKTKSDMTATLVAAAAVDLKVGMLAAFFTHLLSALWNIIFDVNIKKRCTLLTLLTACEYPKIKCFGNVSSLHLSLFTIKPHSLFQTPDPPIKPQIYPRLIITC
jgi:hypothetical protein